MYDIDQLVNLESTFKNECKKHFIKYFANNRYESPDLPNIVITEIDSHDDIANLRYGSGLYLILTDYMMDNNHCAFEYGNLKAIYRGHGVRMKKRIESHLYNTIYNQSRGGTNYTVCMKLNSENGIDLNRPPYSDSRWCVIQHSMTRSSKTRREQAEQAFNCVYGRPIGSNA